jgi:hypothetical protein
MHLSVELLCERCDAHVDRCHERELVRLVELVAGRRSVIE